MVKKLTIGLIIYIILLILGHIILNLFNLEFITYVYTFSFVIISLLIFIITALIFKEDKMKISIGNIILLLFEYMVEIFLLIIVFFIGVFFCDIEKEKVIYENNNVYVIRYDSEWPNVQRKEKYRYINFLVRSKEPIDTLKD